MSRDNPVDAKAAGVYELGNRNVARVGYGAMQLARCADTPKEAQALLQRAIELGVDHIDTAQFYGNGFVNQIVGETLKNTPGVVIATKVGGDPDPQGTPPIRPAQRPEQLRASVEDNLRSLGVEQLALVNLRRLDAPPGLTATGDQIVDLEDQLATLIALRDEGKIGAIGLSAVTLDSLKRALPAGVACVQNAYSMISRQYEDMLDLCVEQNIAWVPFFPLGGAHSPGWPKVVEQPKIVKHAQDMGVTPSQIGLAWLLAHRPNILLIPGTTSIAHLEENIAAASLSLDGDLHAAFAALSDKDA